MKFLRLSLHSMVILMVPMTLDLNQVLAQESCVAPCEFRFAIYGDSRSGETIHQEIVSKLIAAKPSLILTTGDVVESVLSKSQWEKFDEITEHFRQNQITLYPAVGNHDVFQKKWATDAYKARVPEPSRPGSTKLFYAFDKGKVRFISINSLRTKKLQPGQTQYEWLESELRDARATGKFIIPYFHIALFSIGNHGSKESLQKLLHPLFLQYGVKLVFQGHDHNYYRTLRCGSANSPTKVNTKCASGDLTGITYVVSGGGGAGLYNDKNKKQGLAGDKFEMANNYTLADVFPSEIVLTTYSSREPAKLPYKRLDKLRCPLDSTSPCQVLPVD